MYRSSEFSPDFSAAAPAALSFMKHREKVPVVEQFTWGPTNITFGSGAVDLLVQQLLASYEEPRVALVCGQSWLRRSGWLEKLERAIQQRGAVTVFGGVAANPTPEAIDSLAGELSDARPDVVLAVGGGSVIDAAKVANCVAASGMSTREMLRANQPRTRLASLAAVPTTAGTGSEVTSFATVWDTEAGAKLSLDTPLNRANWAALDPRLTAPASTELGRQTAADAFSHAIESLWSRRANTLSTALSLGALDELVRGLPRAEDGGEEWKGDREAVVRGSLLAGMAISLTRTAAAHAMSYALTLRYGVPHGSAVAELIPGVLRENLSSLPPGVRLALERIFERSVTAPDLLVGIPQFLAERGLIGGLARFEVPAHDLEELVEASAVPGRLDNNLIELSVGQIRSILAGALGEHPSSRTSTRA